MATLPKFGSEFELLAEQAPGNVTRVNTLARLFDAFAGGANVLDRDLLSPPGGESEGDLYLVAASGSPAGDWSTFANDSLALYINGAYVEIEPSENMLVLVADEDVALRYDGSAWVELTDSVSAGVTASTTQSQGEQPLASRVVEVDTVANVDDAVTLMPARAGARHVIRNAGANQLQVFPASGDAIDTGGTNASVTVPVDTTVHFVAIDGTRWYSTL